MKRLFLPIVFAFICFYFNPSPLAAQGTCSCLVDASRNCNLRTTNCATGFSPICTSNLSQCNSLVSSCTCTAADPADTTCGDVSQPCCGGNPVNHQNGICDRPDLTCYSVPLLYYVCLTQAQINALPGGSSPPVYGDVFCDASGNPTSDPGAGRINSALGCLPYFATPLIQALLPWGISIAGGISLIVFVYASFLILTSTGNFKRVQAGRELFFASFVAICFIALSVVILNFLGLQILNLGSLGFSV